MNVLLTGGRGLLGHVLRKTKPDGVSLSWTSRTASSSDSFTADIVDEKAWGRLFEKHQPNVLIHAAAIGSVDQAEKEPEAVAAVNVGGTEMLLKMCQEYGAKMVYLSSNAVFDGEDPPYADDASQHPVNEYGKMKAQAEQLVRAAGEAAAIARPIMMYGWPPEGVRDNPVTWWVKSLRKGQAIKVVDNVYSMPLFADDCAKCIWAMIQGSHYSKAYNISGPEKLSLYDFAKKTAEIFKLDSTLIEAVPDTYFPAIAPRPRDTSFLIDKAKDELGFDPLDIYAGLKQMVSEEVVSQ